MHILNNVPPLHAEVKLTIQEVDPLLHYTGDIYNDQGEVIGKEDEDTQRRWRREAEDKIRFRVLMVHDNDQMGLLSPMVEDDPVQRRHALGSVLSASIKALVLRLSK